jgi:hypothetical protein
MRKLLAIGAALTLAFAVSGAATARPPAKEFAVGSAKTETVIFVGAEHASFSVHNVTGTSCEAKGQIVYKSDVSSFTARLNGLTISPAGNAAYFEGRVTKVENGPTTVGDYVAFDATDSGMPGGTGDTFVFEFFLTNFPGGPFCLPPLTGHPITSGNIVIKTAGP